MTALAIPPPDLGNMVATPLRLSGSSEPLSLVGADLMPDEIRAKRRVAYLKRRMVFGLVALLLLIGLGDALARQQTTAASADLAAARARVSALNRQAARFGQVVGVRSETQEVTTLLAQAMGGEVPWALLTAKLQRVAPPGLTVTGVDAKIGADDDARPATAGAAAIGSLSLTGTAVGYRAVADYVSALSGVPGLTGVTPATAATGAANGAGLNFTITAVLTAAAQGGRYGTSAAAGPTATSTANPSAPAASTPVSNPAAAGTTPAATHPSAAGAADAQVGN